MAQAKHVPTAIPAPKTGANTPASSNFARTAHFELIAALLRSVPRPVPLFASAADLEGRAEHLGAVHEAVSTYVRALLADTAHNVPGGLELRYIEGALAELGSDITGAIRQAANDSAARFA